jgi:sugar transferase (PEP-CTERM/EpsH1 system associated)
MRILFITDYPPYPPVSGDRIRVYNLIRRIARQHAIWLATPIIAPDEPFDMAHLQEFCCGVETAELRRHKFARLPGMLRYALAGKPIELDFLYSEELANKIKRLAARVDFDIIQIEQSRMAPYLETFSPKAHFKSVLVFHNITSIQSGRISHIAQKPSRKLRAWLYGQTMSRWEPRYAERFDRCITMSEVDRRLLLAANPRLRVNAIPNGVDTHLYQPMPLEGAEPALLLIGNMEYAPCADGALWFCNQILPQIRRAVGQVQVWIVGRKPIPEVTRLDGDGVHVTGRVEDVLPYYRRSNICIVPLRAGSGTRLKIPEAMALGRPIISTTIGCEGLEVVDGEHLLIADGPEQFAEKTVRLLTDGLLYQRIVAEARQLAVAKYDWDVIAKQLLDIYSEVIS